MDHEKGHYGSILPISSHSSSNGISDLINEQRLYDGDAEIEAAAAQSETPMPVVVSQYSNNSSLKPLHVQVNGFNGPGSEPSSTVTKSNEISFPYFPAIQAKPRVSVNSGRQVKDAEKDSTSPSCNILMGPPSASCSVLLSPAGNLHNGFPRSSGESSPLSPATFQSQRSLTKRDSCIHPLGTSNTSSNAIKSYSNALNRSSSTLQSSSHTLNIQSSSNMLSSITRKEIEMGKRKAVTDKLHKLREEGQLTGFLPQIDSLTDTQMAFFMKKNKVETWRHLPVQIRNHVFEEKKDSDDRVAILTKRIRFSNVMRIRDNNPDEVTDISDNEEDAFLSRIKRNDIRPYKVSLDKLNWNEKKMRIGVQAASASMLYEETNQMIRSILSQMEKLRKSSGCRFEGEEPQPRKRRIVDGQIQLFDNSVFKNSRAEDFGCARTRPMVSWTKRKLLKNIFDGTSGLPFDPSEPGCSTSDEKLPRYDNKNIAIGSQKVVTKFGNSDNPKREIMEYEYCSYEDGKGMIEINEIGDNGIINFITPEDFRPIENRLMSYLYRLSVAPAMVTRKAFDRSTLLESGMDEKIRNGAHRQLIIKEKKENKERRKEKKMDECSSDEEDWIKKTDSVKPSNSKKRGRGRPSKVAAKRTAKPASRVSRLKTEYGIDDYYPPDEPFGVTLPPNTTYARIYVPSWEKVPEDMWIIEETASNSQEKSDGCFGDEDLRIYVSKNHHKLMFLEKERFKLAAKKIRPNKSAAARVHLRKEEGGSVDDEEEMLERLPPFDIKQFQAPVVHPIRRFASIERPFAKREFPLKTSISC